MDTLLLLLTSIGGYLLAYHTYGKFLARKIFRLQDQNEVPSITKHDGVDYVPTERGIVFGHHYTSIAGTGPIVGPAIGLIWGWLPAVLWIIFGSIFMGAVHDFGSLVVSMRNDGKSISEIAARYINKRVRLIFFMIVFLTLLIVIAIFGVIIGAVFSIFPSSVIPVWLQIPIAMTLGWFVYKKSGNITLSTTIAVVCMYACIYLGSMYPVKINALQHYVGLPPTGIWVIVLLIYAWFASTLSVTTLLQPRDYINAWQLFIAMGLLIVGTIKGSLAGALPLVAPAINTAVPPKAPSMWPFMFVIIACGAISGFHSLVASGTSPKQLAKESDGLFVGYGSMLLEGLLAVLVIICIAAGVGKMLPVGDEILTGRAAWDYYYSSWIGGKGLSDKLAPVIQGSANIMSEVGIPHTVGITLMGVFIASFAGTTLDTAVRLQRYIIGELATDCGLPAVNNKWIATTLAVVTAAALAFMNGANGTGAMTLWPLFGSTNQLLAALSLLVVTMYLKQKGGLKFLITAIPCLFMLIITGWAILIEELNFIKSKDWPLSIIGSIVLVLAGWMTIETVIQFIKKKN